MFGGWEHQVMYNIFWIIMGNNKAVLVPKNYKKVIPEAYSRLDLEWFVPSKGIENRYVESSFNEIFTFGFFETTAYLRDTLKKLDTLLSVGGKLEIDYYTVGQLYSGGHFIRPLSFFQYELSLSFGKRFKLIQKKQNGYITKLIFEKIEHRVGKDDNIFSWSFGIVSDGRKDERICEIVNQIRAFDIPHYEILICGPRPKFDISNDIKVLDDSDLYWDLRVPITAKKNRLINSARYENLVLMHDRISFPSSWYENVKKYGNCFEILVNKILDEDTHRLRVQDWMHYERDFVDYKNIKAGSLLYSEWNPTVYVDGGFIICKTAILKSIGGYNEALHWGEAEDVDLSKRLYQAGYMTNINLDNYVFTQTHRHTGFDEKRKFRRENFIRSIINDLKKTIKLHLQEREYNKLLK